MHSSVKMFVNNIHVNNNNPHNKLRRKILLGITIYKPHHSQSNIILNQHTLQWGNIFAYNGKVLVHRNNHPTFSNPTITIVHLVTVHACIILNQTSFSINIHYNGEIYLHITGKCLCIGITIQLFPILPLLLYTW